jgi:hypothetical protein
MEYRREMQGKSHAGRIRFLTALIASACAKPLFNS